MLLCSFSLGMLFPLLDLVMWLALVYEMLVDVTRAGAVVLLPCTSATRVGGTSLPDPEVQAP